MAGTQLGRYEILKPLAKGALTELLLARSSGMEGFQRHVAIKRLRAEFARDARCVESFVNEARLAAVLHHHNVVQVHDIGEEAGQPYFAMEYVHGVDLRTLLAKLAKRNEQLPLQHVVSIVASAAAALHHAHEQRGPDGKPLGIVHRDVTPGNILVGYDGNVKVVDFGIAKAAIKRIQTDSGVLKGQAPYMSPEQCAGKTIDRRSDVWALGVVLYELATVRRLFKGASEFLTMSAIVNGDVPKPSQYRRDIPPQLEAIMLKALTRDAAQRFQTAGEMSLALDQVASTVGVGASTTALANYMRLQFGDQKEPWLTPSPILYEDAESTQVDFDGAASGLAPPPSESVQRNAIPRVIAATKSSPIVAAREHAITPPVAEKPRLPLPAPRVKGSTRPPPLHDEPRAATDAQTDVKRLGTATEVDAHAPTMPSEAVIVRPSALQQAARRPSQLIGAPDASATAIVEPLPTTYPQYIAPKTKRSRRALWVMLFAMVFAASAIGAIVLWPGSDIAPAAAPAEPGANAESMQVAADQADKPADEAKPADDKPADEAKPADESRPAGEAAPAAELKSAAEAKPAEPRPGDAPKPAAATTEAPKSGMQMTMADYERERAAAEAAKPPPPAGKQDAKAPAAPPAAAASKEPAAPAAKAKAAPSSEIKTKQPAQDPVEPVAKQVAPAKRTTTKPPAKRTAAKAAAKPATKSAKKPTKKPKWNPDDLFLDEK